MNLIQIDRVQLQTAQAILAFLEDARALVNLGDAALWVPSHRALCENVRTRAFPSLQCAGDYFLRMADAVHRGGVNPIDAKIESAMDCGHGVRVLLRAPAKIIAGAANGP